MLEIAESFILLQFLQHQVQLIALLLKPLEGRFQAFLMQVIQILSIGAYALPVNPQSLCLHFRLVAYL